MPTRDIEDVDIWENTQAQSVLEDRSYVRHFAEIITRRLRLELGAERQSEPAYSHSLANLERTAHYFMNAARFSADTEGRAYRHESAVLFEQVSDLLQYKQLPDGPDSRYFRNQAILSALMYYVAGYEANAIVLAGDYLQLAQADRTVPANCACLFLSKRFAELRSYIQEQWNGRPLPDPQEYGDDSVLAELTRLASDRSHISAAMSLMDYIRTGDSAELHAALRALTLAATGYEACDDTVSACISRTLALALQTLGSRALLTVLDDYESPKGLLPQYSRLLFAGPRPVAELWRSQLDLAPHILTQDENAVVSLPTSAGKTRLAELAIVRALETADQKKAVYLVPTRALAAEVENTLAAHFAPLGFRVSALFGGYDLSDFEEEIIEECQILVATPEKADLLIRSKEDFLSAISLIICDEGQQVGNDSRGITYEFILSRVLWHAQHASIRIVMLSAVLSNVDIVSKWLQAGLTSQSGWKPTRTRVMYFTWHGDDGRLCVLDDALALRRQRAFIPGILDKATAPAMRDGWIALLAMHFVRVGSTMVFTPLPSRCETLADRVRTTANRLKIDSFSRDQATIDRDFVPKLERVLGAGHKLVGCVKKGIAFHHGRLPHPAKICVERMVRSGLVPIIVANETLAQGVNLPTKTIIVDTLFRGSPDSIVSTRDFWNIAGRAGRAGRESEGYVVFVEERYGRIPGYRDHAIARGPSHFEATTSALIASVCSQLLPRYHDIWARANEVKERHNARYPKFWPAAIDLTVERAEEHLPLREYTSLRNALTAALEAKLSPAYRWTDDREHWADVLTEALRRILLNSALPFEDVDLTSALWKRLLVPIDSQLLASIVEDILSRGDDVDEFLATTLFAAEVGTTHPLFRAFGNGLRARYAYVCAAVPDTETRKLFNSTGLSVEGNKAIETYRDGLLEALRETAADDTTRTATMGKVLSVAEQIPDLASECDPPRTPELVRAWVEGQSLEILAAEHFSGDIGNAVRTIERDVVRKIAWGVHAVTRHIEAAGFPVADSARWLRNLPAMVGYGVPTPAAAFASAQGIDSRNDSIVISRAFRSENEGEGYSDFIEWFTGLHERGDLADILRDAQDLDSIARASEERARGYRGAPPQITFRLRDDHGLQDGQEVVFFQSTADGMKYEALTTKYVHAFDIRLRDQAFHRWMQERDYIARFESDGRRHRVQITFV